MSAAVLFGDLPPEPPKWTERDVLDAVHQRFSAVNPGNGPRYVVAEHVRNQAGFGGYNGDGPLRTLDAIVLDLWPSSGNAVHGIEVKVSRSDWLTELKDPEKAEAFRPYCDHFWLAVPDASIVRDDLPAGWGLLVFAKVDVWDPKTRTYVKATSLRARKKAPKIDRQPMPFGMTAAWMRAATKTAGRRSA